MARQGKALNIILPPELVKKIDREKFYLQTTSRDATIEKILKNYFKEVKR